MEATLIKSVPQAMRIMKGLGDESIFCDTVFLQESREAVGKLIYGRTQARVSAHLEACQCAGIPDRRNGSYRRRLLVGMGNLELNVPRSRTYSPVEILERYARRAPQIDKLILAASVAWPFHPQSG